MCPHFDDRSNSFYKTRDRRPSIEVVMRLSLVESGYLLFVALNFGSGREVANILKDSNRSLEMTEGGNGVLR